MEPTDPLELDSLPSDPKEIVLRMLGMTTSTLKDIDSNITGNPNAFIKGLKLDAKKVITETLVNVAPSTGPTPVMQPQTGYLQVGSQHPQSIPLPQQQIQQSTYDPNQLEFDFYKKIKPEDLDHRLKNIENNLKLINEKLEILCARKVKKKLTTQNANNSTNRNQ